MEERQFPYYCSNVKQAGFINIESKAIGNDAVLCIHAVLFFQHFVYAYILAIIVANSIMILPVSSSLIMPVTILLFPIGSGLLSSFEYLVVSNLGSTSFAMSL